MSDYLNDVYPISVDFVDGQQPTAAFLNAWENQIDVAFSLLSQSIGDLEGDGGVGETYVTNLARALGKMGWINSRLPRDLRVAVGSGVGANSDLPVVEEDIGTLFENQKSALLSFLPAATEATDGNSLIVDSSDPGDELGTAQTKGVYPASVLSVADRWVLDGRRVLTSSQIASGAKLSYGLETDSTAYKDAYGEETGANIVPSIYEIASALGDLVVITQPGGYGANEYLLTFPEIRRIQNPLLPDSLEEADTIKLDDPASTVRWTGTSPKWRIPTWLYNKASEPSFGGTIPDGTVALWHDDGTSITRVSDPTSADLIRWDLIPGDYSSVKITVNFTLPAAPGAGGDNRYIVAFAGTSVAEALVHERARMLAHKHDGQGDDSLVEATHLSNKFDEANFYFSSSDEFNHFPQYLQRGGYDGSDELNRNNAILGALLIGNSSASPSSGSTPSDLTTSSHSIIFGDYLSGPSIRWSSLDTDGVVGDTDGKLTFAGKATRQQENAYFGPTANTSYLTSRLDGSTEILEHNADAVDVETLFETGVVHLRGGKAVIEDQGGAGDSGDLQTLIQDGTDTIALRWSTNGPTSTGARVESDQIRSVTTAGDTFTRRLPLTSGVVHTGVWQTPPRPGADGALELAFHISIPDPKPLVSDTQGFAFSGTVAIQKVEVNYEATAADGATEDMTAMSLTVERREAATGLTAQVTEPAAPLAYPSFASASASAINGWETDPAYSPVANDGNWEEYDYFITITGTGQDDTKLAVTSIKVTYEVI